MKCIFNTLMSICDELIGKQPIVFVNPSEYHLYQEVEIL